MDELALEARVLAIMHDSALGDWQDRIERLERSVRALARHSLRSDTPAPPGAYRSVCDELERWRAIAGDLANALQGCHRGPWADAALTRYREVVAEEEGEQNGA